MTETYLYVQSVARRLKCSERTVYRLIQEGKLRAIRVGGRALRIPETAFIEYLEAQAVDPEEGLQEPCRTL